MGANKLGKLQRTQLKELAANMHRDGATLREIADTWNASENKDSHVTRTNVHYILARMRQQHLSNAASDTAATTEALLASLVAKALGDPRTMVTWENGKPCVRDSDELTTAEASMFSFVVKMKGGEKTMEIQFDAKAQVAAAKILMDFMHGTTVHVHGAEQVLATLTRYQDREGLERFAMGKEDPVKILCDRAPYLVLPAEVETNAEEKDA